MIKQLYHWLDCFFFMLGAMYIDFIKGDFNNGIDDWYWIRIHLSYRGKRIGGKPVPFIRRVEVFLITLFGLVITLSTLFGLIILVIDIL